MFLDFMKSDNTLHAVKEIANNRHSTDLLDNIINSWSRLIEQSGDTKLSQTSLEIYNLPKNQFNAIAGGLEDLLTIRTDIEEEKRQQRIKMRNDPK